MAHAALAALNNVVYFPMAVEVRRPPPLCELEWIATEMAMAVGSIKDLPDLVLGHLILLLKPRVA